ncbi:MAG: helix-turn-helix domain-containing protein [Lachnospiraceae bacterium]|nr:helix-turn-helix domain-containing protein [Lachnospiraceae bacterium]
MAFSYDKLWKLLINKKMTKENFRILIKASPTTIAAMGKGEGISPKVLERICIAFECQPGDIMEYVFNKADSSPPAAISTEEPVHAPEQTTAAVKNTEKQYRRFTQKDAAQIDRQRLIRDIQYQLDISLTFGSDVFSSLLAEAKQSKPSPSDGIAKTASNNTAASPDTEHKAPSYDPAIAGNETLSEKLARLRREHSSQESVSSKTTPD